MMLKQSQLGVIPIVMLWLTTIIGVRGKCDCPPTELLSFPKWSVANTWDGVNNSPSGVS